MGQARNSNRLETGVAASVADTCSLPKHRHGQTVSHSITCKRFSEPTFVNTYEHAKYEHIAVDGDFVNLTFVSVTVPVTRSCDNVNLTFVQVFVNQPSW
jgi:hypothetical protein